MTGEVFFPDILSHARPIDEIGNFLVARCVLTDDYVVWRITLEGHAHEPGGTMTADKPHELLLRAQLAHGGHDIIAHTVGFTESFVSVQTDRDAGIGDRIHAHFSFPGLVEPFSLETQVIDRQPTLGPGDPGTLTLGFLYYTEAEQRVIRDLLRSAREGLGPPTRGQYRVLVVEDNDFVRDAFAFGLRRLFPETNRVSVELVSDSDDALDRLLGQAYDLAIVDYFLPTANGDRLIARLRSNPGLDQLPIFAFSARADDVRQASLDAGADLFLQKPTIMRSLFPTLVQLSSRCEPAAA